MGTNGTKSLAGARVEIKNEDKGEVDLVFATYNVIDKDGDVQVPGTFENGAKAPVSAYGHTSWEGKLPVGVATIKSGRTEAVASAKFFLDTPDGAATFSTVKQLHAHGLGDWSYGYAAKEYKFGEFEGQRVRFLTKQHVKEISPVLEGAGVRTRTLSAKSARHGGDDDGGPAERMGYKGILPAHESDHTDAPWDPAAVFADYGLTATGAQLRAAHAWHDPSGDPEQKSSYHLLHHGPDQAANIRACYLGIAALNGAKGAPGIPDDVKRDVYEHLAGHLHDAGAFVPELRSGDGQLKMFDEAMVHLAGLTEFLGRVREVGASRRMKGKGHTNAMTTVLGWTDDVMREVKEAIENPNAGLDELFLKRIRDRVQKKG